MSARFVGRVEELRVLTGLLASARRERAPAVGLVTGDPGSGKSRLLREVVADTDPERRVMVSGFQPTEGIPLSALGDLVRRLTTVPTHGQALEALVFGPTSARGAGPLAVFEAAHRALAALGHLVLIVDDLQWVDEQSMALLHYLIGASEATRGQLVVIAASRPSEAATLFAGGIAGRVPESRRATLHLGGLALPDGIALARAIDDRLDDETAEQLWRRASGSPFWLEAVARDRRSTNTVDLVTDRLRALSADSGALLNALAIGGRPFAPDELGAVLGWSPRRVDHAARELIGRGLAVDEHGILRLAHDLLREAAAATIPPATRRSLHARLAAHLQRAAGGDLQLLAEALDHRAAAGLPTADLAAAVLRSPQRRLISVEGLRRLASISDALDAGSEEQLRIDRGLGKLGGILGEQALAERHWLRVATHDSDLVGRQRAAAEAALAAYRLGRAADSHAHLDLALATAPPAAETSARIEALRAEIALWLDHDTPAGAASADRALAAGTEMVVTAGGLDRLSADSRYAYLGAILAGIGAAMQQERFDEARRLTDEALLVARELDDEALVEALLRGGFALRPLGAMAQAEGLYREAWNTAHRAVLPYAMIDAGIGLSRVLRDLGRLAEARRVAVETVDLEARLGTPPGRWGNALATLHLIELSLGEASGMERLREDARSHPNPHYRTSIHQQIAAWQARMGGGRFGAEVEAELAAGRMDAQLAGCPRCGAELDIIGVEALARIGEIDRAKAQLSDWDRRPIRDYPERVLWRTNAQAAIAVAEGEEDAAAGLLDRLASAYEEAGRDEDLLWVRLDIGGLHARGDRTAAIDAYTAAASLADRIGARSRGRLAAQALRRLGVRAWRRTAGVAGGDGLAGLSAREREVAQLVATGWSNREIAETLVLSPKTVERHITNILAKVGARNRTELARRIGTVGTGIPR